jgi:protein TonB
LPAAKPTPPRPAEAKAAPRTPAPPASPPSPARTAGDRRSTVDAPEAQVSAAGSSVEPAAPVVLDRPHYRERPAPPRYPMRARELEQQGLVLVRARLDPIGDPVEVEVLRSSGFRLLDEAAAEAVRQWRFVPARRDGHGVEALVQIPVRFTLN